MYGTRPEPERKQNGYDPQSTSTQSLTIVVPHPRRHQPPLRNRFEVRLAKTHNGCVCWNIDGRNIAREQVSLFLQNTVFPNLNQYNETMTLEEIIAHTTCYWGDDNAELRIQLTYAVDLMTRYFRMLIWQIEFRLLRW